MIEYLQMAQQVQVQDIERSVVERQRFAQGLTQKRSVRSLWQFITSLF